MSSNSIQFHANVPVGKCTCSVTINGDEKMDGPHFDSLIKFLTLMRREAQRAAAPQPPELSVVEELDRYKKAMDAIYNHNEAARTAVVQHFGTVHPTGPASSAASEENNQDEHRN